MTSESEPGFHDFSFAVEGRSRDVDGSECLAVVGRSRDQAVGFEIRLAPTWKSGTIGQVEMTSYFGKVTIRSRGAQSDALLREIDNAYETGVAPGSMAPSTAFAAISLEGNPSRLGDGLVMLKLFFESEDESGYAELFLNIDAPHARVQLREKDPDYRRAVVLALKGDGR